jgi:signal transduction histidine kinase
VLDDFIVRNREVIIERARSRVASRTTPKPTDLELRNGVPMFLDQLGVALRLVQSGAASDNEQINVTAGRHGADLFSMGLTVGQVVHDYGDVCQAITELAVQFHAPVSGEEFQTLNLCLDDAIAGAVAEYARQREVTIRDEGTERLGELAHEVRNLLNAGMLAFESIKTGRVSVNGSTGGVLERSLLGLRSLIDRSLADVRLDAGIHRRELISVADVISEAEIGAQTQAESHGLHFSVSSGDHAVTVEGDRQVILAAVSNLLQNAFKFSHRGGTVSLRTRVTADRVCFDIEDECGGLPPGKAEELFRPFEQRGADRSGVGLGLSICMKSAKANAGDLRVRDIPGKGCVFTLDLPRKAPPPLRVVGGNDKDAAGRVGGDGTAKAPGKSGIR